MKKYYKGSIIKLDDVITDWHEEYTANNHRNYVELIDGSDSSTWVDLGIMSDEFRKAIINIGIHYADYESKQPIDNPEYIKILDKRFHDGDKTLHMVDKRFYFPIIFEEFTDEYGIYYGKELLTGLIFPIANLNIRNNKYKATSETNLDKGETEYKVTIHYDILFETQNMNKIKSMIADQSYVTEQEVEDYLYQFGLSKRGRKYKDFKATINKLYQMNSYRKAIVPNDESQTIDTPQRNIREKQSSETIMMERIEFMLKKLEYLYPETSRIYEEKYQDLLKGNTSQSIDSILPILEADIECHLLFGNKGIEDILADLDNLKVEYLASVTTNYPQKGNCTIKELDKITELLLKTKYRFDIITQRKYLRTIAFLYLIEVYQNRDEISSETLENSYFCDLLKTIIISIEALKSIGIIQDNTQIDLNEEPTRNSVLEIIKKIKFNQLEKAKVKELIKKL